MKKQERNRLFQEYGYTDFYSWQLVAKTIKAGGNISDEAENACCVYKLSDFASEKDFKISGDGKIKFDVPTSFTAELFKRSDEIKKASDQEKFN